jgi:fructose-1,6-bisphosphatase/inositol monophosphatase family enzyme
MVEEAGGKISDIDGSAWNILSPHILVSNSRIHEQMIAVFRKTAG